MPIIGLNYKKIHAEKADALTRVDISTTPKVIDVKKVKVSGLGQDIDVLSVDFEFLSKFEPKAGEISIQGTLMYRTDDAENAVKMWKKDKKLPIEMNVEIINYIFSKIGVFALLISDALGMPPVIGLPKLKAP